MSWLDKIGVLNILGLQINPATEETLAGIAGKDFATESTLSTVNTTQTNGSQVSQIVDGTTFASASVEARAQTPTGNALNVQIGPGDVISNIPVVMDFQHHQCHEGESFGVQYYSATPATIEFSLIAPVFSPTIASPHLVITLQTYGGAMQVDLYEGATHTGGTVMTAYNRNRNSANTPSLVISSGVTNATPGTLLPHTFIAAAAEKQGDTNRVADEIVMKSNTEYRVVLEEITATTRCILHFEWYEDLGV